MTAWNPEPMRLQQKLARIASPADRAVVAAVAEVIAHSLDRTREIAGTARIVAAAAADARQRSAPACPTRCGIRRGLAGATEDMARAQLRRRAALSSGCSWGAGRPEPGRIGRSRFGRQLSGRPFEQTGSEHGGVEGEPLIGLADAVAGELGDPGQAVGDRADGDV